MLLSAAICALIFALPRMKSREKEGNVASIGDVLGPEPTFEQRLFQQGYVNKIDSEKEEGPVQLRP